VKLLISVYLHSPVTSGLVDMRIILTILYSEGLTSFLLTVRPDYIVEIFILHFPFCLSVSAL